jgi:hypothetical protein
MQMALEAFPYGANETAQNKKGSNAPPSRDLWNLQTASVAPKMIRVNKS